MHVSCDIRAVYVIVFMSYSCRLDASGRTAGASIPKVPALSFPISKSMTAVRKQSRRMTHTVMTHSVMTTGGPVTGQSMTPVTSAISTTPPAAVCWPTPSPAGQHRWCLTPSAEHRNCPCKGPPCGRLLCAGQCSSCDATCCAVCRLMQGSLCVPVAVCCWTRHCHI
jgi:hypothetical protein